MGKGCNGLKNKTLLSNLNSSPAMLNTGNSSPAGSYMLEVRSDVSQPSPPLIGEYVLAILPRRLSLSILQNLQGKNKACGVFYK